MALSISTGIKRMMRPALGCSTSSGACRGKAVIAGSRENHRVSGLLISAFLFFVYTSYTSAAELIVEDTVDLGQSVSAWSSVGKLFSLSDGSLWVIKGVTSSASVDLGLRRIWIYFGAEGIPAPSSLGGERSDYFMQVEGSSVTFFVDPLTTQSILAGYQNAAKNLRYANEFLAWVWHFSAFQMHWADYYNNVDWALIYNAWQNAVYARDNAAYAYWNAPTGSIAEHWAYESYQQLVSLEYNLWIVYAYEGAYPSFISDAIANATYGQVYLSYAVEAAAGRY